MTPAPVRPAGRVVARLIRYLAVIVVAGGLFGPSAAMAHAALITIEPADGSTLEAQPDQAVLTFNEPVSPIAMSLLSPGGETRALDPVAGGNAVTAGLPAGLAEGTHLLSWRVVSEDGHPIGGTATFSIGAPSGTAAQPPAGDGALATAIWAVRLVLYSCLFVGAGGTIFLLIAPMPRAARLLSAGLSLLGLALLLPAALLQGLDVLGQPLGAGLAADSFAAGVATSYGRTLAAMALAFAAAALVHIVRDVRARTLLVVVAWGAGAVAPALSGHAASADPQWLTRAAVALHGGGLLFWIGTLVPLAMVLRDESPHQTMALSRFSRWIPWAVVPMLVSGIVLAAIQLGWPGPGWLTPYALILACKLALVAGLLLIALWNRAVLTGPALKGTTAARRTLARTIAAEVALVLVVLGLVAGWRFTPPPRTFAAQEVTTAEAMLHGADAMASVAMTPDRAGPVSLVVHLMAMDGSPLAARSVSITLSHEGAGVVGLRREAVSADDGSWQVDGVILPVGGRWAIAIEVRVDDFTLIRLEGSLALRG